LPVAAAAGAGRVRRVSRHRLCRIHDAQCRGLSRSIATDRRDYRAYPGKSPEEVERYVTIPLEIVVASTPGLTYIRSNAVFALGFISLQFEYGRDYNFVRQQVINRLKDATLPASVTPVISPAGGISEILRYQLKGPPGMDLIELKTLQD
jgi:cobalt-zinc-cadmium resistance protein CzcA